MQKAAPGLFSLVIYSLFTPLLPADTVTMRNGERFSGSVLSESDSEVVFESEYAGRLTLPRSEVLQVKTERPAPAPAPATKQPERRSWFSRIWPGSRDRRSAQESPHPVLAAYSPSNDFDWVQMSSGEWLKGEVLALQDDVLEFDSKDLDDLLLDWDDVDLLVMARPTTIGLRDRTTRFGYIEIDENQLRILNEKDLLVSRTNLEGLTPGGLSEWDFWELDFNLGLSFSSGNVDQSNITTRLDIERRKPTTRLFAQYLANTSSQEGDTFEDNQRLLGWFDWWMTRKLFLRAPAFDLYRDPFQNLSYRLSAGLALGYDILDRPGMEWNVTLGPGYQWTRRDSVLPGEEILSGSESVIFGTFYSWDISDRLEFESQFNARLNGGNGGGYSHNSLSTLEFELSRYIDLDVSFIWDRLSNPQSDVTGVEPATDDFRLIFGVGVEI